MAYHGDWLLYEPVFSWKKEAEMPVGITSVQIDLDKKNILAFSFANQADHAHFEQHGLKHFTDWITNFINDPAQAVAVISLLPGQDIKLIKVIPSEVEDATPPSYRPD